MDNTTRARMIADETAKFMDLNFGQLDLSGFPDLQHPVEDRFEPCDRDGLNRIDLSGMPMTNRLKEFLRNPDAESLQRVANETGDIELIGKLEEDRRENEAIAFLSTHPDYHVCDENYNAIADYLDEHGLEWNERNLAIAYKALSHAGALQVKPGTPRPLTEQDRRAVALQASSGDVEGAVTRYLQKRLPEDVAEMWMYSTSLQEAMDDIADPLYKHILAEAVWYCWEHGRPNYSPTHERRFFMQRYVAGRIPTARLLDEAWRACQQAEKDVTRGTILGQLETRSTEPEQDLDNLSDQQVDSLYHASLRQFAEEAKAERRGAGIYH